jgi:hypothetical protein
MPLPRYYTPDGKGFGFPRVIEGNVDPRGGTTYGPTILQNPMLRNLGFDVGSHLLKTGASVAKNTISRVANRFSRSEPPRKKLRSQVTYEDDDEETPSMIPIRNLEQNNSAY